MQTLGERSGGMIELNSKNNVLMECEYKYSLQDRETGNLYRDM